MANNVEHDQTAPSGAVWSGSTLFAYAILLDTLVYDILGHLPYLYCSSNLDSILPNTKFTQSIQTPYLVTISILKFEFTTD